MHGRTSSAHSAISRPQPIVSSSGCAEDHQPCAGADPESPGQLSKPHLGRGLDQWAPRVRGKPGWRDYRGTAQTDMSSAISSRWLTMQYPGTDRRNPCRA